MKRATEVAAYMGFDSNISIHALVKRATYNITAKENHVIISIHALVKRATDIKLEYKKKISISIHALVKRATFLCS